MSRYEHDSEPNVNFVSMIIGWLGAALGVVFVLALVVFIFIGVIAGAKTFGRYQGRQDASNNARIAAINENKYTALIEIEKQKAEIRRQEAIGIRDAQETINSTLTPLYVQHEAIMAQENMINSPNHTVIYIPVGTNGVPFVQQANPNPSP